MFKYLEIKNYLKITKLKIIKLYSFVLRYF